MTGVDSGGLPGDPFDPGFLASLSRLRFAVQRLRAREGEGRGRPDLRGGRVEFADHRAYSPGDDLRFMDWAAYARTGRLVVKEFEREDELKILLLVDASASMGLHGKLTAAVRLAYALAFLALDGGSRVRVGLCSGGRLRLSGEVSGTPRIRQIGRFLSSARAEGGTSLTPCLGAVPEAARGSRVVMLISDLLTEDDGRRALAGRCRRGDEVDVLHLWSAGDHETYGSGPVTVEDVETGERLELGPGAAEAARAAAKDLEEGWRRFAARHRLRYLPVDAAATTEEVVLRLLRAGGVLK